MARIPPSPTRLTGDKADALVIEGRGGCGRSGESRVTRGKTRLTKFKANVTPLFEGLDQARSVHFNENI